MPAPSPKYAQDPVLVAFGDAIRRARNELRLSQEALAHLAELDRSYMSSIERGSQNVGLIVAARIARALDRSVAELMLDARI